MQAEYLVESRTPDVEEICEWIENSSELLLCIHGTAGVGKSTLAGHLSKELRAAGRLAGLVFLGAFPTDTSGPETIIKMLAHEIGSIHPRAIPKILEAMQECYATSLETHLQKYILEPLQSLNHPHPLVIIVDALDEWRDRPKFIHALAYLNSNASVVKVIGTSRLDPVASQLPGIGEVSVRTYQLVPASTEVMKAYFEKHLKSVPWMDGRMASPGDIDKLAELSGGLPVWAATVVSLLLHQFSESPPHETLAEIVGSRRQVGGSDGLGELYQNALKRLFVTPDTQKYFRRYFGAIIALQESVSLSDFSTLVGIPMHLVTKIQATLPAVQTRSPPPGMAKMIHPATMLFHLSLVEYVQATSAETSFTISTFDSHAVLGLSCLKQLAGLPSPSPHHDTRLRAIQHYAVKYWPLHVSNGTLRSNDQWLRTEHYSTLRTVSAINQRQWATLFHKILMPGEDGLEWETEDGMESILGKLAHRLGPNGGDHWRFQAACLEVAVRFDDGNAEAWSRLGLCYEARGDRMGSLQMCEEAVVAFRHALKLRPDSHPDHAESLDSVANALWSCYQLNGNRDSLSESISCSRKALALCPAPHPERDRYLNTLAIALNHLYDHDGDLKTLHEVIALHREGLDLCPAPHPGRDKSLNNLATSLRSLHGRDGSTDVLIESISLHREALALRPAPHPYRPSSLDNLANALNALFIINGDDNASTEAISLYHEALALRPVPHPGRWMTLNNVAFSL
jgi:tetratricopeptide (TPR) repeat protein